MQRADLPLQSAIAFLGRICANSQPAGLWHRRPTRRGYSCSQQGATWGETAPPEALVVTGAETEQPRQLQAREGKLDPPFMVRRTSCARIPADAWQNGAVLVDKPQGWTSFDVCGKLRGIVRMRKVGHAGTLDPLATGLLIVCTGKGTKHAESFMAQHKEYTGTLRLGQGTPSYDAEAEVDEVLPWDHITDDDIAAAQQQFLGDQMQLPPMFSAVKVKGERLYFAARRGEQVERQPRAVRIMSLDLDRDTEERQDIHFKVACSKGTYVRTLVHDLGRALGTVAHMTALRRTQIGEHRIEDAWSIADLNTAVAASREAPASDVQEDRSLRLK